MLILLIYPEEATAGTTILKVNGILIVNDLDITGNN